MFASTWSRVTLIVVTIGAVVGGGVAAYGPSFGFDDASPVSVAGPAPAVTGASTTTASEATTTTLAPTTTTHVDEAQPADVTLPAPGAGIAQGRRGDVVTAYEQRLKDLRFDPGPIDGYFDQKTRYAVEAVQKLVGLPRTGRIGPDTAKALEHFTWPESKVAKPEQTRVEIDLDRQVLIVWTDWKVTLITTTSTGSGRHFCGGDGGCQYAVTPAGDYTFTRHQDGWRKSKLGMIWNPWYFNGGIAVHGYSSVPTYNASHGCARIPMHIADYFGTLVHKGEPVHVVGTPAHGGVSADPSGNRPRPPSSTSTTTSTSAGSSTTGGVSTTHPPTTAPPTTTPTTVAPTTAPPTT